MSARPSVLAVGIVLALIPRITSAQSEPVSPHFDVVSIRPATAPTGIRRYSKGRIDYEGIGPAELIMKAFGVLEYQIGWPKWIPHFLSTTPRADLDYHWYTISATFPPATTSQDLQLMLQNMLRERFHLVAHRETREWPLFEVTIAEGGIRMHESPPRDAISGIAEDDEHFESARHGQKMSFGELGMHYEGDYTIALLAADLSGYLPYRMIDKTGLSQSERYAAPP